MSAVPFCVFEEHHEAFFVWHWAISKGIIAPTGNTLLHIDEHADIGAPRLHRSLHSLGSNLDEIDRFTFEELSCFEFIVPALYQKLFDQLLWIRQHSVQKSDQLVGVHSLNGDGRSFELKVSNVKSINSIVSPQLPNNCSVVRYRHQSTTDPVPASESLVLDIDLDFFSCEDAVNLEQKLEVTQAEYEKFQEDRYHFLRIAQGSRIKMREEGGQFFLYLKNYPEPLPMPLRVSESEILQRLHEFVAYLKKNKVVPRLINSARSRFSGYTPSDQWQFIETNLIERLGSLYDLDVFSVDRLRAELFESR